MGAALISSGLVGDLWDWTFWVWGWLSFALGEAY
jgi:hypothetical protein